MDFNSASKNLILASSSSDLASVASEAALAASAAAEEEQARKKTACEEEDRSEAERLRIALKVEYDGTDICGSQIQPGVRTVQEDLEKALSSFFRTKKRIVTTFSGRTDSGVHALGQVVHFELSKAELSRAFNKHASKKHIEIVPDQATLRTICWALNGILKEDVSVSAAQLVQPEFHARFSADRRTYVYRLLNREQRPALGHNTQYFIPALLNLRKMRMAAAYLIGTHDFRAFKSANGDTGSTICQVERSELLNYGEGKLEFWISANHFVYNMVRIIVGTLVDIGLGKREPSDLSKALTEKDRGLAGPTAPPSGLCLHSVDYPAEFNLFQRDSSQESAYQEI